MADKVLLVDDDPDLLASLERLLRREFQIDTALGGKQALEKISSHGPYAVVVSDRRMPDLDGVQIC